MTGIPILDQYIMPEPNSGCWLWVGARSKGYGYAHRNGKTCRAHIYVYAQQIGPIPIGLELDHLCRVRCCVNPSHLEPVTRLVNVRRGLVGTTQRSQTTCKHGHPFDEQNTHVRTNGTRRCCECSRAQTRAWRARKAELV